LHSRAGKNIELENWPCATSSRNFGSGRNGDQKGKIQGRLLLASRRTRAAKIENRGWALATDPSRKTKSSEPAGEESGSDSIRLCRSEHRDRSREKMKMTLKSDGENAETRAWEFLLDVKSKTEAGQNQNSNGALD
jgi:hypothetical protein